MAHPALPAIQNSSNPNFWDGAGKMLDGLTTMLLAEFPEDDGVRVSVKVLQGAVNGLILAMNEEKAE